MDRLTTKAMKDGNSGLFSDGIMRMTISVRNHETDKAVVRAVSNVRMAASSVVLTELIISKAPATAEKNTIATSPPTSPSHMAKRADRPAEAVVDAIVDAITVL